MERRTSGLGCIVAGLGVAVTCFLLPYLASSAYSVASTLLDAPAATRWLWGDWLSTLIEPGTVPYRLLVETPVCCAGMLALVLAVLGVIWMVGDGREEQADEEEDALEDSEEEDEGAFDPHP